MVLLSPRADSKKPFPSVLFAYFLFLPRFPVTGLCRESNWFWQLQHAWSGRPLLCLYLPPPLPERLCWLCWTSHHLFCCCYSLCGQVHSLSGVQMDRSLRCLCVLCRGASPPPTPYFSCGYLVSCKSERREKGNDSCCHVADVYNIILNVISTSRPFWGIL